MNQSMVNMERHRGEMDKDLKLRRQLRDSIRQSQNMLDHQYADQLGKHDLLGNFDHSPNTRYEWY